MTAALRLIETPYADEAARFAAMEARDREAEGRFWVCVKTTGIFCLPTCAARPPLKKNVVFARSRAEAMAMGYRPCKRCRPERFVAASLAERIDGVDWARAGAGLDECGWASLGALLSFEECNAMIAAYTDDSIYRSTVTMSRHGFGSGEYRYYAEPLPCVLAGLRERLYPPLATIASRWSAALGQRPYPATHSAYRRICADAGQTQPTPLILKYGPGDYNRLHQDLYGGEAFPIQAAFLLSEPGRDFEGGEFILTEQRPRMQSRATVAPLKKGEAIAFAVNDRPLRGARGTYRAKMRHGVSALRAGARFAAGIIFHDAE